MLDVRPLARIALLVLAVAAGGCGDTCSASDVDCMLAHLSVWVGSDPPQLKSIPAGTIKPERRRARGRGTPTPTQRQTPTQTSTPTMTLTRRRCGQWVWRSDREVWAMDREVWAMDREVWAIDREVWAMIDSRRTSARRAPARNS